MRNENEFDVIIIGAGIGGLGAGNFLQAKNPALKTIIIEHNNYPGGYVSGFRRKGVYFDLGAEGMLNFEKSRSNKILNELGFTHPLKSIEPIEANFRDNEFLNMYSSRDKLLTEIETKYPHEKENVINFLNECDAINNEIRDSGFSSSKLTIRELLKVVFKYPKLRRYGLLKFSHLLDRFLTDENVKNLFKFYCTWLFLKSSEVSAPIAANIISEANTFGIDYPVGGMLAFAENLVNHYCKNGGQIKYKSTVDKIVISKGAVKGVKLSDGTILKSTWVISNADLQRTIFNYVGEENFNKQFLNNIKSKEPSVTGAMLFLTVENIDLTQYPPHFNISNEIDFDHLITRVREGYFDYEFLGVRIPSNIDPNLEVGNKKSMIVLAFTPFDWNDTWKAKDKRERKSEYKQLKKEVTQKIITRVEKAIPNLSKYIISRELSTQLTFERYNLVSKGAWYATRYDQIVGNFKSQIKNLLFAGSNVSGGGVGTALHSGLRTGQYLSEKIAKNKK